MPQICGLAQKPGRDMRRQIYKQCEVSFAWRNRGGAKRLGSLRCCLVRRCKPRTLAISQSPPFTTFRKSRNGDRFLLAPSAIETGRGATKALEIRRVNDPVRPDLARTIAKSIWPKTNCADAIGSEVELMKRAGCNTTIRARISTFSPPRSDALMRRNMVLRRRPT